MDLGVYEAGLGGLIIGKSTDDPRQLRQGEKYIADSISFPRPLDKLFLILSLHQASFFDAHSALYFWRFRCFPRVSTSASTNNMAFVQKGTVIIYEAIIYTVAPNSNTSGDPWLLGAKLYSIT
jgi:hypothetical protein